MLFRVESGNEEYVFMFLDLTFQFMRSFACFTNFLKNKWMSQSLTRCQVVVVDSKRISVEQILLVVGVAKEFLTNLLLLVNKPIFRRSCCKHSLNKTISIQYKCHSVIIGKGKKASELTRKWRWSNFKRKWRTIKLLHIIVQRTDQLNDQRSWHHIRKPMRWVVKLFILTISEFVRLLLVRASQRTHTNNNQNKYGNGNNAPKSANHSLNLKHEKFRWK